MQISDFRFQIEAPACLLVLAFVLTGETGLAQAAEWKGRWTSVKNPSIEGLEVEITLNTYAIVAYDHTGREVVSVDVDDIIGLAYANNRFSRAGQWGGSDVWKSPSNFYPPNLLFTALLWGGGTVALLPFRGKNHYVLISSIGRGKHEENLFEIPKGAYLDMLDTLTSASGVDWINLVEELEKLEARIEVHKDPKLELDLRTHGDLPPGPLEQKQYRLVLLSEGPYPNDPAFEIGVLYVFKRGKTGLDDLIAPFPVRIRARPGGPERPGMTVRHVFDPTGGPVKLEIATFDLSERELEVVRPEGP